MNGSKQRQRGEPGGITPPPSDPSNPRRLLIIFILALGFGFPLAFLSHFGLGSNPPLTAAAAPAEITAPFFEDFESGSPGWTSSGLWHPVITPTSFYANVRSPVTSWWYGLDETGNYDTGITNTGVLTSPLIYIPYPGLALHFWYWYETECYCTCYDHKEVDISVNGDPFSLLYQVYGYPDQTWTHSAAIDLTPYAYSTVQVRFRFDTGDAEANIYRGWYVDDFAISLPNDDFDFPQSLNNPPFTISQTTLGTSVDLTDPVVPSVSAPKYNTVWYRYVPYADGLTTLNTFTSSYDTVLAVWTGARGSLQNIACNDDQGGAQSGVAFDSTRGVTYYVEVAGSEPSDQGDLVLSASFEPARYLFFLPVLINR